MARLRVRKKTRADRLTWIEVENFKSFRKARLELGPLTVLVGANAAGKTNYLEALEFLSWLARGNQLSDLGHALREGSLDVRGRPEDLFGDAGAPMRFSCGTSGELELSVTLKLRDHELYLTHESLRQNGESVPLYSLDGGPVEGGHDVQVAYNNFARGGKKPKITCSSQQLIFTQLLTPARFLAKHKTSQNRIPRLASQFKSALQSVLSLDPKPATMRGYIHRDERRLDHSGRNLSGVLWGINGTKDREEILAFVQELPEQQINDISFLETPRDDVMLQLTETFGDTEKPVDAALLSDGTLRVLAIAAALLSAPRGSVVVIEEVDNGVHPSRAASLLERILTVSKRRELSVLITTHNPAMLDGLPKEAIPHVAFCYRSPHDGDSHLEMVTEMPDHVALLTQGRLGDLLTRGVLDRYAKNPSSPEVAKRRLDAFFTLLDETTES